MIRKESWTNQQIASFRKILDSIDNLLSIQRAHGDRSRFRFSHDIPTDQLSSSKTPLTNKRKSKIIFVCGIKAADQSPY